MARPAGWALPTAPGADAQLGSLANNGGQTDTIALGAGSAALDFAGACGLAADQRGVARPFGAACDSGAFERNTPVPVPAPVVPPAPATPACSLLPSGNSAGLKVIVACDLPVAATLSGAATIRPAVKAKKRKAKKSATKLRTIKLGPVKASLTGGKLATIRVRVPTAVAQAVARKGKVSLKLTLSAVTAAGGRSSTTASITKLAAAPVRRKPRR